MTKLLLTVALILPPHLAFAQNDNQSALGWDLTYTSVLNANQIAQDEWIRKWLGPRFQSPIKKYISRWKGESIESSILIEHPAFHAGEHITRWFVRTKNYAYRWVLFEDRSPHRVKQSFNPAVYDKFFAVMSQWQQAPPLKPEDTPDNAMSGYMAFLSVYDRAQSREMLLTLNDFFLCETKKCDRFESGRLMKAMEVLPHY